MGKESLFSSKELSIIISQSALPLLWGLGFGAIDKVHNTAKTIFYFSIVLTTITVASVSYVGAYVPSIVGVVLLLSGIIMLITKEKEVL